MIYFILIICSLVNNITSGSVILVCLGFVVLFFVLVFYLFICVRLIVFVVVYVLPV